MVDYFASTGEYSSVVRFNGGSQAGHTVVTPDGARHVCSQIGAGAVAGLHTHLSRFMLINPIFLMEELGVFADTFGFIPPISFDPECEVVLPIDVMANRQHELARDQRGEGRHGSVGHGINHAVRRGAWMRLTMRALGEMTPSEIMTFLAAVRRLFPLVGSRDEHNASDHAFIETSAAMFDLVSMRTDEGVVSQSLPCIFEGAQGLLLDQNSGFYPHVTPSNTGLQNVLAVAGAARAIDPVYVTRSYTTRHGAGPMYYDWVGDREWKKGPPPALDVDTTNIHNDWQHGLRYGPLVVHQLEYAVRTDLARAKKIRSAQLGRPSIALTWADAGTDTPTLTDDWRGLPPSDALKALQGACAFSDVPIFVGYTAHTKTRKGVTRLV
jgi:adenylosuccinate synthase